MERGRRKILIVDDEQAVRDLFVSTLGPAGLDVVALADPDEGIEAAKKVEPDIIYMSLLFPESNGLKVGKSLHSIERLKETPIVVLISYEGELDPKYTRTIGIVDVLVKPLKPSDILAMTNKLLGEDISSGMGEPGVFFEETEDIYAPADDDGFLSAGGSGEDMTAGPLPPEGSSKKDVFEMTDEVSDDGPPLSPDADFAGGKTHGAADLTAEAEEDTEGDVFSGDAGGKEGGTVGLKTGGEDSVGYAEDEGEGDEDTFEGLPERKNRSAVRYILFAALVLLVAAAVFAALQSGIFTGGRGPGELSPAVVKSSPAKKETVREAVQPGKLAGGGKIEDLPARKQDQGEAKTLSTSSPSQRKVRPAAHRAVKPSPGETRILNEGLKEPKTFNEGQKKIYSVQAGAFGKEGNAVSFARKLKVKGYDAFVGKGSRGGLHRVLIGRFDDYGKALRESKVLLQKEGIKSVIYRH